MGHPVLRLESPFLFQPFFMFEPPGSPRYRSNGMINVARCWDYRERCVEIAVLG